MTGSSDTKGSFWSHMIRLLRRAPSAALQGPAPDSLPPGSIDRDLAALVEALPDPPPADGRTRVAIASFGAGPDHLVIDCLLAHALRQRGAETELLVCDMPELPGCDERLLERPDNRRCIGCLASKQHVLDAAGVIWRRVSGFLGDPARALAEAEGWVSSLPDAGLVEAEYDGWPVGRWLGSSVASFLRADSHGDSPEVVEARRRYLATGRIALDAARGWFDAFRPTHLLVISGRHIMWRAAFELARRRGIKVVSREMFGEEFDIHIYSVNGSAEDPSLPRAWAELRSRDLTPAEDEDVDRYLGGLPAYARQTESAPALETNPEAIRARVGLTPGRPLLVLFANVAWDLFVAERDHAFDGQMHWIRTTVEFAAAHPAVDLVIRAHPAEIVPKFRTRGRIVEQVRGAFPELPGNVHLVGPESDISSDALRAMAGLNLVYCASVGLEAVIARQPLILAGVPYYGRKGFTLDAESVSHYLDLLDSWVAGRFPEPDPQARDLARKYLYLIRFRYGIRMGLTEGADGSRRLLVRDPRALLPGGHERLDAVCEGILRGDEILFPVE